MVTITEVLVAEHRVFLTLFDQVERALPGLKTMDELRPLCRLLQALLHKHGEEENDLSCVAVSHILKEHKRHARLHHDHRKLDALIKQVAVTKDIRKGRSRLRAALAACRAHFGDEEQVLFPLIERALRQDALLALGKVWMSQSSLSRARS